ncbi:MAG: 1-acyl-sn-glycerol-3-phosphate acyltransferase, partial [Aureliella sp.]
MQNVIVDKPYKFIAPYHGGWPSWLIQKLHVVDWYLKRAEGIESHEVRGIAHLRESLERGHSVLLAPNHCRYADPIAIGWIARQLGFYVYSMASWHLFQQNRWQATAMRLCGGFSVYREGVDRQSLNTAVDVLVAAKRPLVVFPEGTVFRTNDRLQPLLDGVAFLARTAAKRRVKHDGGKVVIHPVAIKYLFRGDLQQTLEPIVQKLEKRLSLDRIGTEAPLLERVNKLLTAQLALQEIKYLGAPSMGCVNQRQLKLIEHLLAPLEQQWLGRRLDESIMPRV